MPTSVIIGMRKATELELREGLEKRYRRHKEIAEFTREDLQRAGLNLLPEPPFALSTVSVAMADPKLGDQLRTRLVSQYNVMTAGGLGEPEGKITRIGHMGTSATVPSVTMTLAPIGSILEKIRS